MEKKIYKKTFIAQSHESVTKIDDHLAFVEDGINELQMHLNKLTKGNAENLSEQSQTTVSSYEDRLARMRANLYDMYTYKNDILEDLEKMGAE